MARMTGGEALVESLIRNGVEVVFGLPGIQIDFLFNALHDAGNRIRVMNSRHEQGCAYMAYGYAQSTGRVGVYAVVPGPGLLNTTAALSTAWGGFTPVLAISGQIPSHLIGRDWGQLHEIPDQLGMIQKLTKWAHRIDHPAQTPARVNEAFTKLVSGRPRPVELEMALDVMAQKAEVELLPAATREASPKADPDLLTRAAELLAGAEQPMIFVGGGAYGCEAEVKELAELLQAPVSGYFNGRGILDERHYLGHANWTAHQLWTKADVVLALGSRLMQERTTWGVGPAPGGTKGVQVIHVDIEPTELRRVMAPTIGITADAKEFMAAFLPEVAKRAKRRASRKDEMLELKARFDKLVTENLAPQVGFLKAMRGAIDDDALVVDEFTQVAYVARVAFPVYAPRTMITPNYQGALGYGYATALGVKAAHPDKQVLSMNGDGGFMFNVQELSTAVKYGLGVVAVVFSDNAFGNVRRMQQNLHGGRVIASDLRNPDFVKLAESFGAMGLRAHTPDELAACIRKGFKEGGPVVIEVPVGEMPEPFDYIRPPRVRALA